METEQTEDRNQRSRGIDELDTPALLKRIHEEDAAIHRAVGNALPGIGGIVEMAVQAISAGGTVWYAGAGTSGRLGVLDAAEIMPTFGSDRFRAVIAGGGKAVTEAVEGAEDDAHSGADEARRLGPHDLAIGITASGRTPFVLGYLRQAVQQGNPACLITSNPVEVDFRLAELVVLETGAEVIAGSTRMKAGTAQKMVLNMISTATMVRLGGTYDGYMVDVMATNEKLIRRARGIICRITGVDEQEAGRVLEAAAMRTKTAIVMINRKVEREEAEKLIKEAQGSLRKVLNKK